MKEILRLLRGKIEIYSNASHFYLPPHQFMHPYFFSGFYRIGAQNIIKRNVKGIDRIFLKDVNIVVYGVTKKNYTP